MFGVWQRFQFNWCLNQSGWSIHTSSEICGLNWFLGHASPSGLGRGSFCQSTGHAEWLWFISLGCGPLWRCIGFSWVLGLLVIYPYLFFCLFEFACVYLQLRAHWPEPGHKRWCLPFGPGQVREINLPSCMGSGLWVVGPVFGFGLGFRLGAYPTDWWWTLIAFRRALWPA